MAMLIENMKVRTISRIGSTTANSTRDCPSPSEHRKARSRPPIDRALALALQVTVTRQKPCRSNLACPRRLLSLFIASLLPLSFKISPVQPRNLHQSTVIPASLPHRRLAIYLSETLQKLLQFPLVRPVHQRVQPIARRRGILRDELEADTVVAPANGPGVHDDCMFEAFFPVAGYLQRHQNQGARVPTLLRHNVQPCRADVLYTVCLRSRAGPGIGCQ